MFFMGNCVGLIEFDVSERTVLSTEREHLVIIGCGLATGRLLDEMARFTHSYRITVIGDEPHGSYNRIMLSKLLAGETGFDELVQKDVRWFSDVGIGFLCARVTAISTESCELSLDNGDTVAYDRLVIATGSSPAKIPAGKQSLPGIYSFRTREDVELISSGAMQSTSALVVGGGLLGLEAAYGLARMAADVTLVHRSGWLMNRQLDEAAGRHLQARMEALGIRFLLADEVETFCGDVRLTGAVLKSGEAIDCEVAVIATGIRPNGELGEAAGLDCNRAILVDEWMNTSDDRISALGECCEFRGQTFGLVDPIWMQCEVLARRLCDRSGEAFKLEPVATRLKVSGIDLYSAGEHLTGEDRREVIIEDAAAGVYRKLVLHEGRITGIVLFGDTHDGASYFQMMQDGLDVSALLPELVIGESFCKLAPSELQLAEKEVA